MSFVPNANGRMSLHFQCKQEAEQRFERCLVWYLVAILPFVRIQKPIKLRKKPITCLPADVHRYR